MRREVRQLLRGSRAKMYRPIERTAKLTRLVSMGYTFAQACGLFAKYFKRGLLYRNRRHKRGREVWEFKRRKLRRFAGGSQRLDRDYFRAAIDQVVTRHINEGTSPFDKTWLAPFQAELENYGARGLW